MFRSFSEDRLLCLLLPLLLNFIPADCQSVHVAPTDPLPFAQPSSSVLSAGDEVALFSHDFPLSFKIHKDESDPSRLLNVQLPGDFHHFKQFIARVTDISNVYENRLRDANRTFLASPSDNAVINIHGLNPGHQYSIAILGRKDDESTLIKEESVVMDPIPLDFNTSSTIRVTYHNVTIRVSKPERALQDTFRVEYIQLDPLRRYPILDVHDIQEQREVELYLGNLNPGRDYSVTVTSIKNDLPSVPWKGVITTKPFKPVNLSVSEVNAMCVSLFWTLPPESGADRFKIAYGVLNAEENMRKLEVPYSNRQVDLCDGVLPGQSLLFAVVAEKSHEISDPSTISYTVRPLPPSDLKVVADFSKAKFRVELELPSEKASKVDKCLITVVSEQLEKMEHRVPAVPVEEARPTCTAYMDLVPGRRYEVSAASLSGEVSSTKMFRSKAIEPGFDMKAFGLTVSESHNVLHVEWPQSEVTMLRISDVWAKIVGNDTKLHVKVEPLLGPSTSPTAASKDNRREVDLTPSETKPVTLDKLRRGGCYKAGTISPKKLLTVHLYTVTSSGIVSTQRFEEFVRITAPVVELRIDKVSKNSAALQVSVADPEDRRFPVSPDVSDCVLNVMVMDEHSLAIYDRSITLQATSMPPIPLEGLRPFHRYVVNSQVVCGQTRGNEQSCPQKIRTMQQINFETRQDRPGPVQNLTVKALNPYSAQLLWWPPALPNGVISHYIIDVKPEDSDEKPWTVNVGAPVNLGPLSNNQPVQAVVDNLIGGQTYRMGVQAVTEAGAGDTPASSENVEVEMPVLAPPRPNLRLDTVPDTIRSSDLTIRYNTAMFNTKHGLLRKIAIIVAQVAENGKINDIVAYTNNSSNDTLTWSQVQRFEVWPPYVAVETPMEPIKRYSPRAINEVLGLDMNCADRPKTQVCNGPLKPGTTYRFKLRLYTAPNLWTDTLYSDVVTTEPLQSGATLRGVLFGLGIFLLCAAFAATVLLLCNRRRCRKGAPAYAGTSYGGRRGADHASSAHYASSKESQWKALKMIMAERAADCLAKLGLDSQSPTSTGMASPVSVAGNYGSNGGLAQHFANGDVGVRIIHGGGGLQSPSSQTSSLSGGAAPTQQNGCLTMAAAGSNRVIAANPQNGPFGPSHHRRTCSLRERRTGADQRLERLPSGPPPGQKVLLWTIIKGPNTDKSRAVRICDFPEHVRMMSADSDFRFSEEYEDLRNIGNGQTCIAADCTMNRAKNRFTNILPYDHSRVKLIPTDDEEGSDYINANYIPGFNSRREFIAAQGPLPSTRDHFWRVVWEQQCPAIVALTKCVEKGRDKCHQYWPDNNQRSVLYGDIEVTLMTECIEYEDFTVREMRLTNFAEPNHPARTVLHLHYMAWPDFGVPDHPAGIVRFARLFRSRLPPSPNNKPTIVHCSAGVGRSGTFIALDRLVQHIECGRPIDVFGTVYEMRLERCHMVQNEQQYIFIHHCLMYVLENFFPQLIASGAGGMSLPTSQSGFNFPAVNGSAASGNGGGGHHAHAHPYSQVVNGADSLWISSATKAPRIEVHQNPAFLEDDEGIAESGL